MGINLPRGNLNFKKKKSKKNKENPKLFKTKFKNNIGKNKLHLNFDKINYKLLDIKCQFLGIIRAVHDYELKVTLPGRLIGTLPITNISDDLNKTLLNYTKNKEKNDKITTLRNYFVTGQYLQVQVEEVRNKKNIILTCNPKQINANITLSSLQENMILSCSVKSLEDYGYILETGLPLKAFLPDKEANAYLKMFKKDVKLKIGQYILCSINASLNSGNLPRYLPVVIYNGVNNLTLKFASSLNIKSDPDEVLKIIQNVSKNIEAHEPKSFDAFVPGSIIKIDILQQLPYGHEVSHKLSNHGYLPALIPWRDFEFNPNFATILENIKIYNSKHNDYNVTYKLLKPLSTLVYSNLISKVVNQKISDDSNFKISSLTNGEKTNNGSLIKLPIKTCLPAVVTYVNPFTKSFAVSISPQLLQNMLFPIKYGLGNCHISYSIPDKYTNMPLFNSFSISNLFKNYMGRVMPTNVIYSFRRAKTNPIGKPLPKAIYASIAISPTSYKKDLRNGAEIQILGFGLSFQPTLPPSDDGTLSARIIDFDLVLGIAILDFDYTNKVDWKTSSKNDKMSSTKIIKKDSNNVKLSVKEKIALTESLKAPSKPDTMMICDNTDSKPEFPLNHKDYLNKWIVDKNKWTNYWSIQLGAIFHGCQVINYLPNEGVVVKVNEKIRGFISLIHLSDNPFGLHNNNNEMSDNDEDMTRIEKYRKEYYSPTHNKLLTVRVIGALPEKTQLLLTHKKSLIDSDIEPFKSFMEYKPGHIVQGWIVMIKKGILIAFYGLVKGWIRYNSVGVLPQQTLQAIQNNSIQNVDQFIEIELKKYYHIGQVLNCRIRNIQAERNKIDLEIYNPANVNDNIPSSLTVPEVMENIHIGKFYDAEIVSKTDKGFELKIIESFDDNLSGLTNVLPFDELSDFPENSNLMSSLLPNGHIFRHLLCIRLKPYTMFTNRQLYKDILNSSNNSERLSECNARKLFQSTALPLPKKNEGEDNNELLPGMYCAGKIKCLVPYIGITIQFPDQRIGLIHKSNLPGNIKNYLDSLEVNQTGVEEGEANTNRHEKALKLNELNYLIGLSIVSKVLSIKQRDNKAKSGKAYDRRFRDRISLSLNPLHLKDDCNKISFNDNGKYILRNYLEQRINTFSTFLDKYEQKIIRPGTILNVKEIEEGINIYPRDNKYSYFHLKDKVMNSDHIKNDFQIPTYARILKTNIAKVKTIKILILEPEIIKLNENDNKTIIAIIYRAIHIEDLIKDNKFNIKLKSSLITKDMKVNLNESIAGKLIGFGPFNIPVVADSLSDRDGGILFKPIRYALIAFEIIPSSISNKSTLLLDNYNIKGEGEDVLKDGKYIISYLPLLQNEYYKIQLPNHLLNLLNNDYNIYNIDHLNEQINIKVNGIESISLYNNNNYNNIDYYLLDVNNTEGKLFKGNMVNEENLDVIDTQNDNIKYYTVYKKNSIFLTLQPSGSRLYIDEIYNKFYQQFKHQLWSTKVPHPKILSPFPKGFKFLAQELKVASLQTFRIKKKLEISVPGTITTVPILTFKSNNILEMNNKLKIDDVIDNCYVESIQNNNKVTFYISPGVKGICRNINLSTHKKVIHNPRLLFKTGRLYRNARVIRKYSNKTEKECRKHDNNKTNYTNDLVESTTITNPIIYEISFIMPQYSMKELSDNRHNCVMVAKFIKMLPGSMWLLFKLPRNQFGLTTIFDFLPDKMLPKSNSICNKCHLLEQFNIDTLFPNSDNKSGKRDFYNTLVQSISKNLSTNIDNDPTDLNDASNLILQQNLHLITLNNGHHVSQTTKTYKIKNENDLTDTLAIGQEIYGIIDSIDQQDFIKITVSLYPKIYCISPVQQSDNHSKDYKKEKGEYVLCRVTGYYKIGDEMPFERSHNTYYLKGTITKKVLKGNNNNFNYKQVITKRMKLNEMGCNVKEVEMNNIDEDKDSINEDGINKIQSLRNKNYDWWDTSTIINNSQTNNIHGNNVMDLYSFDTIDKDNDAENVVEHISKRAQKRKLEKLEVDAFTNQILQTKTARDEQSNDSLLSNMENETIENLEREVLAHPNDSFYWSKYIAFHVSSNEISKAREIIKKALQTISYREEDQRLNIWTTSLNMELLISTQLNISRSDSQMEHASNQFSSTDFDKVLEQALQFNNPKKIYLRVSNIFIANKMFKRADNLFKDILCLQSDNDKQISTTTRGSIKSDLIKDIDIWCSYIQFLMKHLKKPTLARQILEKSLVHLDKSIQLDVLIKFALLEFDYGHVERGKTMFQQILENHAKRTDIWFRYIDALTKRSFFNDTKFVLQEMSTIKFDKKSQRAIFKKIEDVQSRFGKTQNGQSAAADDDVIYEELQKLKLKMAQ